MTTRNTFLAGLALASLFVIDSAFAFSINDLKESVFDGSSFVDTTFTPPASGHDSVQVYDNTNSINKFVTLDPDFFSIDQVSQVLKFNIGNITTTLDSAVATMNTALDALSATVTTTLASENATISALQALTVPNAQKFTEIYANIFATSTSMACTNASSTSCFMPKAMYTKVNGLTAPIAYEGTTSRANPIAVFKSATVSSGVAVFNLTTDGTSGGTSLFPNGVIQDSVNVFVSDATASYQMSYAFSNSNKTLTVTANKLTTANILTGLLGQAAATGAVVRLQVYGY